MATTVCFVRHGETDYNLAARLQGQMDVPLNAQGLFQAELIAARLKDEPFDVIYSSDLSRALVTAEKIASGRSVVPVEELREWYFGEWQDLTWPEIKCRYQAEYEKFRSGSNDFRPPGGESLGELYGRAARFMQMILQKHEGKKILCVSHGAFIKRVLNFVLQCNIIENAPVCGNTSIARFISNDGNSWQLAVWNDTAHLEKSAPPMPQKNSGNQADPVV